MSARLRLHLLGLLLPTIAACIFLAILGHQFDVAGLKAATIVATPAVLGAQVAALLCWRYVDRSARNHRSAWINGVLMALLAHFLFGLFMAIELAVFAGFQDGNSIGVLTGTLVHTLFFTFMSLMVAGALSIPLTAWATHGVARRREKELALEIG